MLLIDAANPRIRMNAAQDTSTAKTHAMTMYPAFASFCPMATSLGLL
jgi:hypothetical protein